MQPLPARHCARGDDNSFSSVVQLAYLFLGCSQRSTATMNNMDSMGHHVPQTWDTAYIDNRTIQLE